MNETQISIAGIIFLISTLCACGSGSGNPAADKLLAQAQQTSQSAENGGGGGGQGGSHGKGKGGKSSQNSADSEQDLVGGTVDEETCDASKISDPSTVILCEVGTGKQVCTDASTALEKYGLDPSKPNLVASDGDHLGAC